MAPTPSPEVTASPPYAHPGEAAPEDSTPVVETVLRAPLDDVTPVVPPPLMIPPFQETPVVASPAVIQPVASLPKPSRGKALKIVAAAVVTGAVAGALVFFPLSKTPGNSPSPVTVFPAAMPPVKPEVTPWPNPTAERVFPTQATPPGAPAIPTETFQPAKRHIEITVQPAKASLSLDKYAAEGNQIKLDVPESRTLHMVQATAPGHIPFKKTVSYANDVYLDIKLEKSEAPTEPVEAKVTSPQVAARQHGQQHGQPHGNDPRPEAKSEPRVAPSGAAVEEFGMNLERPTIKRSTKKMDETDPYAP